ncbi:MAG: aminotransferase class V-fold PLP-dependent enzyme [Acidimicrobiia bacterium]
MSSSLFDRSDYPTLRDVVYLNQASLGLIGQPAVDEMTGFLGDVGRHGNTYMPDEDEAGFLEALRSKAAQLLRSDPEQVAILASASELLGQLPLILAPAEGAKIVAVATDFPAVTRPWLLLAERGGCRVDFAHDDPDSDLTGELVQRIDGETAVVTIGSVQYATGTVVDIPRLREATAQAGVRLVVDATQEAGATNRPMGSWGADVVVSSGYKWLGGHGGVAIGVISRQLLEEPPALPGWMSAPEPFDFDATRLLLAPDARRYTQSTISYASAAGLTAAIDQLLDAGLDNIERAAADLARLLVGELRPYGWHPLRELVDPSASDHIISLSHDGMDTREVTRHLRTVGIVAGGRGGRLRISLAPYNNEDDVADLVRALSQL